MRALKNLILFGAIGASLSGCGGGSETQVSFDSPPPQSVQSEYERQTDAARTRFEKRLSDAQVKADDWLENNRRKDGVIVTHSGLQYRVEQSSPNPAGQRYEGDQPVTVHYEGQLIDGTVFDSTFQRGRPDALKPSELIEGWQEALGLMQPGDEWTLFIPPDLAYGKLGRGASIPPNAALIFRVQLR